MPKFPPGIAADASIAKPHIADLLDQKMKADYLGGPSVRGWSKIKTYMVCDRLYFLEGIRKVRPLKQSAALDIGTLFHACMAAHYATGGQDTFKPLQALIHEAPQTVHEVSRLLHAYFQLYAHEEASTWDIRAVEHEVVGSMTHQFPWMQVPWVAPVSCRFDLVIRKKPVGAPSAPYGPPPEGVYVVDHKVHARLSRDLLEGYGMDGQFLLMAYLWRQQGLEKTLGKLNGFILNIITKTANPECKRLDVAISDEDVTRFAQTIAPVVCEMDMRIKAPDALQEANWPMNFAVCKSPFGYGLCKFWDLCISHGRQEGLYEIAPWKQPSAK